MLGCVVKEGGRLTGEQFPVPGRRRSWPGSSAASAGAMPPGSPEQPSSSPASSAMTWFLTRSCATCSSQDRGILVEVDAGQLPESITAGI
jgi:hypothetical protein